MPIIALSASVLLLAGVVAGVAFRDNLRTLLPQSAKAQRYVPRETYDRITIGMPQQKAVAMLGNRFTTETAMNFGGFAGEVLIWRVSDTHGIAVAFTEGKVAMKMIAEMPPEYR